MNNVIFTYNQEMASQAGQGGFISETGAYLLEITEAKWVVSSNKGTFGLELSVESDAGLKANYLSIWYSKSDNSAIAMGQNMVQAIMGCTGVQQLSHQQVGDVSVAPELKGKNIGLVLQKILKTKQDGSDTHSFDIKMPYISQSGQTITERNTGAQPETVTKIMGWLKDKDDRTQQMQNQHGYDNPPSNYDNGMDF